MKEIISKLWVLIGGLLFVIVAVAGAFMIYLRINHVEAKEQVCIHGNQVSVTQVLQRAHESNTSSDPYIVFKISEQELATILKNEAEVQGYDFCIDVINDTQIVFFLAKNNWQWIQGKAKVIEGKPFVEVDQMYWLDIPAPGFLKSDANMLLREAYDDYFVNTDSPTRILEKIEIREGYIYMYSSINF